jgi:citrate lyase subunit beta/citryl-CoA lyase
MTKELVHPATVLLDAQVALSVCRLRSLQRRGSAHAQKPAAAGRDDAEFGTCVFDVTLDCEDGAPSARRPSTPSGGRAGERRGWRACGGPGACGGPCAFQADMDIIAGEPQTSSATS